MKERIIRSLLPVLTIMVFLTSCNFQNLVENSDNTSTQAIDLTQIALEVGGTLTAMPTHTVNPLIKTEQAARTTVAVGNTPTPTLQMLPTNTPQVEELPTEIEDTVQPTETSTPAMDEIEPDNLQSLIQSSNILILEDVVANTDLVPRIDNAVAGMNFSGGTIINTYDASGNFLKYLDSGTDWDLIIASIENRRATRLGIWDVILEHIEQNAAVIIEIYYLDEISIGQITPLLDGCGVLVQENWERSESDIYGKFVLEAYDPGHPIFTTPNIIELPLEPTIYWIGDAGDVLELASNSSAQILAGLKPEDRLHSGLLVSCYNGKVILQTFSTHDYPKDETIALWQNYMNFTLTNHYLSMP